MKTLEQLETDFKEAMKAKNESALSTIRMARTAIKNKQIDAMGKELTEEDVQAVLRTMIKQYKDALQDFERAGRIDLADKQRLEIELLEKYLPPAMSEEQIEAIIREAITESGITQIKDMGKAMGLAMKKIGGGADGVQVRELLKKLLS
ncbi:GatB/YqeY domain-containing protein [Candidatus Uhrbacteria bacterium]|nr:GatB/YqeY domain-containing protein [Candidatus Uhrbacteria bacterium]